MRATSCANSTSISASVRTLAAVASAKARNQNCEATAPMKPANSDGFQARKIANSTARAAQRQIERQHDRLHGEADRERERRRHDVIRQGEIEDGAAKADRRQARTCRRRRGRAASA